MQHSIFLSYRRIDSSGHAGRLTDDLGRRFGEGAVFRDIGSIDAGQDFVKVLDKALHDAKVVLVLIGDTWLSETDDEGMRRLDRAEDYVRREVSAALARNDLVVLPVLVEGARMPSTQDLPEQLWPLTRLQAIVLSEERWRHDLDRLAGILEQAGIKRAKSPPSYGALLGAALVTILLAIGGAVFWLFASVLVESYTGLWYLPSGGYWTVRVKDDQLIVEETHQDSRQVWKRGMGRTTSDGMLVDLELVFSSKPYRYRHQLSLSSDGRSLIGTVTELTTGQEKSLVLKRE